MRASTRTFLIRDAKVLLRPGAEPQRANLLVRDGRIAAIEPHDSTSRAPELANMATIDGRGKLVMAGLVNAHYHSHDVLSRGMFEDMLLEAWLGLAMLPPSRPLSRREVRLRTLLGAIDCLLNGITTVQDMVACGPGSEEHVETIIEAYRDVGIRCVLSLQVGNRAAIDSLPGIRQELPSSLHHLLESKPADVQRILDFVAAPFAHPARARLHWAIGTGAPHRCTLDLLSGLAALAEAHDLPIITHVNDSKLQVFLARELYENYGGSVLGYLDAAGLLGPRLCMAHGIWFSDDEISRIAEVQAIIATNPTCNLKLKNGIAPLRRLRRAGIRLALGCDNTSAGDSQNMFEAMKLICNISAAKGTADSGLRAADALLIATQGGANALRLDGVIGSLEVGKAADLTLLDLSDPAYLPLNDATRQIVYSESGRGVHTVIVDGEIVVENRKLMTINLADLLEEVSEIGQIYARDCREHSQRMQPVIGHIVKTVRRFGNLPLPFNRWPFASDDIPEDRPDL
jgi:cytosine/adenosine deaminase-related metal-dependent hydrolase